MNKLNFSINIKADKTKIWKALWDDASYREWTSVFFEGSYAVTQDWKEDTTVMFLTPAGSGMYSKIEKHIPGEFMSFKHIGNVKDGKEQLPDDETRKWSGAMENYRLTPSGNSCLLTVEMDALEDNLDFMQKTFPIALEKVKALAEN